MEVSSCEPLLWKEARARLTAILQAYVDDPPPPIRRMAPPPSSDQGRESFLAWWIRHDFDLYFGALALSLALLILSAFSLSSSLGNSGSSVFRATASGRLYRAQIAASMVLVLGSLLSLWMLRRSRFLGLNDSDKVKRRDILRFLRAIDKHNHEGTTQNTEREISKLSIELNGNSLTDIYPVYRKTESSSVADPPAWARVPSLLLVAGDYIAIQIGDVAPCDCVLLDNGTRTSIQLAAGERMSVDSFGMTASEVMENLPRGKTTVGDESEHLLNLCNNTSVFLVLEAPIQKFIYGPSVSSRPSQSYRRIVAIRQSLTVLAVILLVSTTTILFSRASSRTADLSLLLPIPILAALGVFPVVGPFFLFFLDIIGTARILVTIHPYASSTTGFMEVGSPIEGYPHTRLFIRYVMATCLSRLSLWEVAEQMASVFSNVYCSGLLARRSDKSRPKLVRVPPASLNMVENLGVATAFTLIDDELACEPHAVPQQLLIPSAQGLKLLDLCPAYEDGYDLGSRSDLRVPNRRRSFDSDSESDEGTAASSPLKIHSRDAIQKMKVRRRRASEDADVASSTSTMYDVQFEDPSWWQFLPSLKCIGLACLMLDESLKDESGSEDALPFKSHVLVPGELSTQTISSLSQPTLVRFVCRERQTKQLEMLANCIGFSRKPNANGHKGDISAFEERIRMHILSSSLRQEQLLLDAHERSSEMSRWWGLLNPDSTSIVAHDKRSGAYQLLTVGDPLIVVDLCHEAWQGERSTILPLGSVDRETIIETTNNWKLADLDVTAFSYSPVPLSLEQKIAEKGRQIYLLDHRATHKNASSEWSLMKNQIFLGVLGSLLVPRREIKDLLSTLNQAGVRFVYFSPRNMRRQKELASQMGIDVAWNCAISLRPLESGEEDPHRMVSNYADWDVNAKLPHGVADVRHHLEEVDNVPLLVSLYTDVTKETTQEMVKIFQEYTDTVVAVGLSHLPQNNKIFCTADISLGIDVLTLPKDTAHNTNLSSGHVLPAELDFVSSIASHGCAFRFREASSVSYISLILEQARGALEAGISATLFVLFGFLSFSLYILFSVCVPSVVVPFIPALGSVLFLQVVLPTIGFTLATSDPDKDIMSLVPPKNDQSVTFARKEGWKFYRTMVLKSVFPAMLPQLLHLISFGEMMIHFEASLVEAQCPGADSWVHIIRCNGLKEYSGHVRWSSGIVVLGHLVLCVVVSSASFVGRLKPLYGSFPWRRNRVWVLATLLSIGLTVLYMVVSVDVPVINALPWYFYVLSVAMPFFCLLWIEICNQTEMKLEKRAEMLRRLQFETRLGAWSPKAR